MIYTYRTFPLEVPLEEASVALVGVPWDSAEIGKSVKHGPLLIREALRNMPWYDLEHGNVFEKATWHDMGDIEVVAGSWELTRERIQDTIQFLHKTSKAMPLVLGGDHLLTLGVLESLGTKPTIVHFDAHADISPDWLGNPFAHITWGARAIEQGFTMCQLGVRSWTPEELEFKEKHKTQFVTLDQVKGPVYLTIDLDVFDPAFAPEVGTPEPLGMHPQEFFSLLQKVCANPIVGMDITECASDRVNSPTAVLASQIIKKVIAWKR